jgi:sugar phosphate isomerase/epimerase
MVPSLWTAIILDRPLPEVLRFLHGCGWSCFELSTEHLDAIARDPRPEARMQEVRAVLAELSATMPQAHAYLEADIAQPDATRREADLRTLEGRLDCCAELGIRYVVIHPGGRDLSNADGFRRALGHNLDGIARLAGRAEGLALKIALENTLDSRDAHRVFGSVPDELLDLIGRIASPAVGIAFDTSHAHVRGLDLGAAIRQLGPLIWCTHISDNDGSSDQHRTPGGGTINWPSVMAALRGIGYQGTLNFEIPGEEHPQRDLLRLKLRHAFEVANWLISKA